IIGSKRSGCEFANEVLYLKRTKTNTAKIARIAAEIRRMLNKSLKNNKRPAKMAPSSLEK
ncbi:MAG: hypothetical protein KJP04_10515, partial [Arenicella sp.]|nr:hypothetical protein [Arenicella sp.]